MSVYDEPTLPAEPQAVPVKPAVAAVQPREYVVPMAGPEDNLQARLFMAMEGFAPKEQASPVDALPINAPGCVSVKCASLIANAYQMEQRYGFDFAQRSYMEAIQLADSQQQRILADRARALQELDGMDQHINNRCRPGGSGCENELYKRDQKMTDCSLLQLDSLMPVTTRINYALACIRSGNDAYMSAGQDSLNQLLRANPQLMTPQLQECIRTAYARGTAGAGPTYDPTLPPESPGNFPPGYVPDGFQPDGYVPGRSYIPQPDGGYPGTSQFVPTGNGQITQLASGTLYERSSYAPTLDRYITANGYSMPVTRTYQSLTAAGDVPPLPSAPTGFVPGTLVVDSRTGQPVDTELPPVVVPTGLALEPTAQTVVPPTLLAQADPPTGNPDRVPRRRDNTYPFPQAPVLDGVYPPGVKPAPGVIPDKVPVKPNTVPGPVDVPRTRVEVPTPPDKPTPLADVPNTPSDRYKLTPQEIAQRQNAWLQHASEKFANAERPPLWDEIKKPPATKHDGGPNDGLPNNPFIPKKQYWGEATALILAALAGAGVGYKLWGRPGESPIRTFVNRGKVEIIPGITEPEWRFKDRQGNLLDPKSWDGKSLERVEPDPTGKKVRVELKNVEAVLSIPDTDSNPKQTEARMRALLDMRLSGREAFESLVVQTSVEGDPALKGKEQRLVIKDPAGKETEIRGTTPDGKLLVQDGDRVVERSVTPEDKIILKVAPDQVEKAKAECRDTKALQELVTGKLPGRDALTRLAAWEADLKAREEKLAQTDKDIKQKTEDIGKREEALKTRNEELSKKEKEMADREHALEEKAADLTKREGTLGEERKTLETDKGKLAEDKLALAQAEQELAKDKSEAKIKEDVLKQQEQKLSEERARIGQRETDINGRDESLTKREKALAEEKLTFEQERAKEAREMARQRLALEQERQKLVTDQADLSQKRDDMNRDREALIKDQKQLLADKEALAGDKRRLKEAQAQLEVDQKRVADLEKSVTDTQGKLTEKEKSLDQRQKDLTKDVDQLGKDQEALAKEKQALADDKAMAEADRLAKEAELASKQRQLDERGVTLKEAEAKIGTERTALDLEKQKFALDQAELASQKEALARDQAQLKLDRKDLEAQKKDLATREEALAKEKQALQQEQERLLAELEEAQKRVKAAEAKADAAMEKARAADKRAIELEDRIAQLESARANFLAQQAKLEEALAALKRTSEEREGQMRKELTDLTKLADERAKALEQATNELKKALSDRKELSDRVGQLEKDTTTNAADLEKARGDLAKKDAELVDRAQKIDTLQQDLGKTKADLEAKQTEVQRVNGELEEAKKRADAAREKADAEKLAREAAEKLAKEANERADALQKRVTDLEKNVTDAKAEKLKLEQALTDLGKEASDKATALRAEIERQTKLAETAANDLSRTTTELKDALAERKQLAEKVTKLEGEAATNAAVKADLEKARADLAASDLALDAKGKEVAKLEGQLTDARAEVAKQEKLVSQARQEVADLKAKGTGTPGPSTPAPEGKKFKLADGGKEYTTGVKVKLKTGSEYELAGANDGKFVLFKEKAATTTHAQETLPFPTKEMTLVINGKETKCQVEANAGNRSTHRVYVQNPEGKFELIGEAMIKAADARSTKAEGGLRTYGELIDAASPKDATTTTVGGDGSTKPGSTPAPDAEVKPARTEAMTSLVKALENKGIQESLSRSLLNGIKDLKPGQDAGKFLTERVREQLAGELGGVESDLPKFRVEVAGDELKAPELKVSESGEAVIRIPQKMLAENPAGAVGQICGDIAQVAMQDGLKKTAASDTTLNSGELAAADAIRTNAKQVAQGQTGEAGKGGEGGDTKTARTDGPAPELAKPETVTCVIKDGRVIFGKVNMTLLEFSEHGLKQTSEAIEGMKKELADLEKATTKDEARIEQLKTDIKDAEQHVGEMEELVRDLKEPVGSDRRNAAEKKLSGDPEALAKGIEEGRKAAEARAEGKTEGKTERTGGKSGSSPWLHKVGRYGAVSLLLIAGVVFVSENYGAMQQKHKYNSTLGGS